MIPKKIHYCWFGGKEIPKELITFIDTWRKYCPDYEIKLWSETNFDVDSHPFTKSAYAAGKFAFVSDYVRAFALYTEGGVYLDTDVELKMGIDEFLVHEAFSGFELRGTPITAVWGSIAEHSLLKEILVYYKDKTYTANQEPNTRTITRILINQFKINPDLNELQVGSDGLNSIHIYPAEFFCLDIKPNYAVHHFYGSWIEKTDLSVKKYIHMKHLADDLNRFDMDRVYILNAIAKRLSFLDLSKTFALKIYLKIRNLFA